MSWGSRRLPPQPVPLDYEAHLPKYNADVLKRIARVWAGKDATKLSKDACIRVISNGLANPDTVQAVVDGLSPFERAGLGLLNYHGRVAATPEFAIELFMLGLPFSDRERRPAYAYSNSASSYDALNSLLEKGLVLLREFDQAYGQSRDLRIDQYHYRPQVFSDRGLLAGVTVSPPAVMSLPPVSNVESEFALQPAEVVLRFVSMVETLRKVGRIDLTSKGRPTKPFLTKLTKALGWEAELEKSVATPLPQATLFFFKLVQSTDLLQNRTDFTGLEVSPRAQEFLTSPYQTQAAAWIASYRSLTRWTEYIPKGVYLDEDSTSAFDKFNGMRAALLIALAALPNANAWYRIEDLSEGIHARIGEHLSLAYLQHFYPAYGTKPDQIDAQRAKWRDEVHKSWRAVEQPWIVHAVTGPLFHLGVVAVGHAPSAKKSQPTLFRLTPLGRAVLYDAFRPTETTTAMALPPVVPDGTCWVVQPNFDVVVYLDRASAARLSFIERIGTRKPSTGATVLYHLTRETVYAALESGIAPDALVETLSRGCDYPLPENIRQTLVDWAARREQLSVYRSVDVLEFVDQPARDAALAKKPSSGVAVGERYLLLSGTQQRGKVLSARASRTVDYLSPPVRCLTVSETGELEVVSTRADLLVYGELSAWAENETPNPNLWQLTQRSVRKAVSAGWRAEDILDNLKRRAQHDLPPLLSVAIRAWAGVRTLPTATAVAADLILQVADGEVALAIAGSALFRPYFRGRLGRRTFLVKSETVDALRAKLVEFGLEVGSELGVLSAEGKE
jgi:Helicase conserved C-terminal domain